MTTRSPHLSLRTTGRLATAAVTLIIGSCGSSAGSTVAAPTPGVLSSISDGAVLADPVQWTAKPVAISIGAVSRVEFLIDGRVRWIERKAPYFFNDDGNRLFPWLLGAGAHSLAVRVITSTGKRTSTSARVTVLAPAPVPREFVGTFTRNVTAADIRRTQAFRHEPLSQAPPPGTWRLHIAANGLIVVDDPRHTGVTEAFTATPRGAITLQGPANWLVPADRQGSFCSAEPPATYHWTAHAKTLAITAQHDACADRNSLFTGTWKRQ